VLSVPYELRLLLASRSEVLSAVMNCHTHLHIIVIDGVYSRQDGATTRFHFVEPPWAQEQRKLGTGNKEVECEGECSESALTRYRADARPPARCREAEQQGVCCRRVRRLEGSGREGSRREGSGREGRGAAEASFANEHVVAWAELMRRTLGINVLQCPVCQATMVLLAVITRREVIDRILTHVKVHSSFSFRVASRELLVSTILRLRRCDRGTAAIGPPAMFAATPRCV